ncbi:(S)-ureidoglycine aminohydrolase [soil metagenome]
MQLFGTTRSRVARDHALICPDSHVRSPLPGWTKTQCVILIAPPMGARFMQYLALMEPGATSAEVPSGIERVIYVLEGSAKVKSPKEKDKPLKAGGFAFLPAGSEYTIEATTATRLNVFDKPFTPRTGVAAPKAIIGHEKDVDGMPFMGDDAARLQVLLPDQPPYDLAVNVFRFQPGAALPLVEIHVMEHGLLMLEGQGVYRLGDDWYPVQAGDVIWMKSFCPQWFVAMGKTPAAYLYYKDVNRDPLGAMA